jgi:hypothetical protein
VLNLATESSREDGRRRRTNSVKHQCEANSSFLENTTQQMIDWIVSNPVKLTGQLQKVGAKM